MVVTFTLWHNPRCTKSRETLALLRDRDIDLEIRLYLTEPPSVAELEQLRHQLGRPVIAFTRSGEKAFKQAGLDCTSDDAELILAIAQHPVLLERPILVANGKAEIGRPPEAVLRLFSRSALSGKPQGCGPIRLGSSRPEKAATPYLLRLPAPGIADPA